MNKGLRKRSASDVGLKSPEKTGDNESTSDTPAKNTPLRTIEEASTPKQLKL